MAAVSSSSNNNHQSPLIPNSGRELLLDLKRSTARNALGTGSHDLPPTLPQYNHKLVRACFRDLHGSARELELQARLYSAGSGGKPGMSARPSILLHNLAVQRNKRCLLAYHHHRTELIKEIVRRRASSGDDEDQSSAQPPISTHASEVALARDYAALREAYSSSVFELGMLPPTSHTVQCRVLKDHGQVVLPDSGRVVNLSQGACLFLDRADAKDFLQRGILQLYDGEEVDF